MARLDWSFLGRPLEKFGKLFNYRMLGKGAFDNYPVYWTEIIVNFRMLLGVC
jgi:hypothetical protein